MAALAFWDERTGALTEWDLLILAGEVWPGIVTIDGQGVSRQIDVKKPKGGDQARLTDEGYRNGKFKATLEIWERAQWEELQRLLPLIHPRRKGGARTPLQIIHPAPNLLGIDNVYITRMPIIRLDRRSLIGEVVIECIEWTEAPKPVKKAAGRGGGSCKQPAAPPTTGDPVADVNALAAYAQALVAAEQCGPQASDVPKTIGGVAGALLNPGGLVADYLTETWAENEANANANNDDEGDGGFWDIF
ncbi:MAG: hypothetical protein ACTSX8_00510 [Alphaproteobacteria bacterium]